MYTIKLSEDKCLITTNRVPLYVGETNLDMLGFLVPKSFMGIDVDSCTVMMRCVFPSDGDYHTIPLACASYNDEFFICTTQITTELTSTYGLLTVWLILVGAQGGVLFESGKTSMCIRYRGSEQPNPPYPFPDQDQLGKIAGQIEQLQTKKADSLVYDQDTQELQLMADGIRIGEPVRIQFDSYDEDYEVTPGVYSDVTLMTKNKAMKDNVTVLKIPQYEVSNEAGGTTLIMGDEYYGEPIRK